MRISGLSLSLALLACALPVAGQTPNPEADNFREIILDIPEKATIRQIIVKTSERTQKGVTTGATVNSEYLNTVVMTEDGYSVSKKLVKATLSPLNDASNSDTAQAEAAQKLFEEMSKISNIDFTAEESMGPLKIDNWPQIQKTLKTALTAGTGEGGALVFDQLYANISPEGAAGLFLQGDAMLATAHNLALNIGETISVESEFPAPMGGSMLQATESVTLDSYDETADSAKVTYTYEPTTESVSAFINMIVAQMMKSVGADKVADPDAAEEFRKALNVEIATRCNYDVSLKTGLVRKGDCVTIRDIRAGGDGARQKETWQLSETLMP